jgi:oxygen-independent coproporphyrinogen-3 oxidase
LGTEDRLRRCIIESIMCHGHLKFCDFEHRFGIDFCEHFVAELTIVKQQADDGLLELNEKGFEVLPAGRLLLRNIAMVFDEHLNRKNPTQTATQKFSRVI